MTYEIETGSYNERRYGRPWIAEVHGKEFIWGEWEGRNGEAGTLRIECEPGTLVARGQKDLRKGRGGVDYYYLAMPDGKLWHGWLGTESAAKHWAREGWRKYLQARMEDPEQPNDVRIRAAKMLGVQDPISKLAAEYFGLTEAEPPTAPVVVDLSALGL